MSSCFYILQQEIFFERNKNNWDHFIESDKKVDQMIKILSEINLEEKEKKQYLEHYKVNLIRFKI